MEHCPVYRYQLFTLEKISKKVQKLRYCLEQLPYFNSYSI